jgi:hypothetical protein
VKWVQMNSASLTCHESEIKGGYPYRGLSQCNTLSRPEQQTNAAPALWNVSNSNTQQ